MPSKLGLWHSFRLPCSGIGQPIAKKRIDLHQARQPGGVMMTGSWENITADRACGWEFIPETHRL